MAFICFFTGQFKSFLIISLITLIHELGHLLGAIYYKWHIEKVLLLPFGGLTIFKEDINRPLKEEFIILILGPIFQMIFVNLIFNFKQAVTISNTLLFFNLLPIVPLDGSKLLNIIMNKITSFKKSYLFTIYVSFLFIFFVLIKTSFNLIIIIALFFTLIKLIESLKQKSAIFNRFLLERYMKNYNFKKRKIIKSVDDMKRDYKHLFKIGNSYVSEREKLKKRFDFKKNMW